MSTERGAEAEDRAVEHLEEQGYKILDRNAHSRLGEVDIVAQSPDGLLCFVEVRMRKSDTFGDPAATISQAKQKKIVAASLRWMQLERRRAGSVRYDVIAITGEGEDAKLTHIPAAFDAGF